MEAVLATLVTRLEVMDQIQQTAQQAATTQTQQLQDTATQLTALTTAVTALAATNPPAPTAAAFALRPSSQITGPLDFNNKVHKSISDKASEALPTTFNGKVGSIENFFEELQSAVVKHGWTAIYQVIHQEFAADGTTVTATTTYNLLEQWAIVTDDMIDTFLATFMNETSGPRGRMAQEVQHMRDCILKSIDTSTKNELRTGLYNDYCYNGEINGLKLTKALIHAVLMDSAATEMSTRETLTRIPAYFKQECNNSDIKMLHDHIKLNVLILQGFGKTSPDLLIYLFQAYKACADEPFGRTVERIQDDMVKGKGGYDDPKVVMKEALQSFTAANEQKRWNRKTEDQKQILALQTRLNSAELKIKSNLKPGGNTGGGGGGGTPRTPKSPSTSDTPKPWAWKDIPPKSGENKKKKTVNGKDYRWCKFHNADKGKWVEHTADQCNNDPANKKAPEDSSADKGGAPAKEKLIAKLALKESFQNMLDEI